MEASYQVNCMYKGEFVNITSNESPNVGDKFVINEEEVKITKLNKVISISNDDTSIHYYNAFCEQVNPSMVGITQVKFITCSYAGNGVVNDLENQLNNFLYETRHTHHIIDITHNTYYIAIKYRLRNNFDCDAHKAKEESYQKEGEKVIFRETSIGHYYEQQASINF